MSDEIEENEDDSLRLTFEEARVLGCLMEKEMTTPDHYPLTLNALHSACNQKSSREPVVDFGTDTVEEALEGLRYKKLSLLVHQAGARVPKAKHLVEDEFAYLDKAERALLCVLLLRGQQTLGELRQRTERMHAFADLDRAKASLDKLIEYHGSPLVQEIPAGGGRRTVTYVHLLCGDVAMADSADVVSASVVVPQTMESSASWRGEMEEEISDLKSEVAELKSELAAIKSELGI